MTGALIPIAGLSRRMGEFKPLLPLGGKTVIECCMESAFLGGAKVATVVTGYRALELEKLLAERFGDSVSFVRNEQYESTDMLHSIKLGLGVLAPVREFFLIPGDMPVINPDTFKALLTEKKETCGKVIIPTLDGKYTHPPLIDSALIPEILAFDGQGGLREFWKQISDRIVEVPIRDRGVLIDLDTPSDYEKCLMYRSNV